MAYIRKAVHADLSRIAEILVFSKRLNYRSIFHNDEFSFGKLQVLNVVKEYEEDNELLNKTWVYDDGFVKGLIQINGKEIETLYVDSFFTNQGIGRELIEFAIEQFDAEYLWVLEKNLGAQRFYERFRFKACGRKVNEPEATEYLLKMERR